VNIALGPQPKKKSYRGWKTTRTSRARRDPAKMVLGGLIGASAPMRCLYELIGMSISEQLNVEDKLYEAYMV
jgi:hypothetical protein